MREDTPIPAELIGQIRTTRLKARLTQEQLADLASISRRPIYLLESGKGAIRLDTLLRILDALGLTLQVTPKRPSHD
jgi:transcriptional regulator with XRE-family HTH domain